MKDEGSSQMEFNTFDFISSGTKQKRQSEAAVYMKLGKRVYHWNHLEVHLMISKGSQQPAMRSIE
jgi:hypothetical protein